MAQPLLNFHFLLLSNPSVQHLLLSSYIPTLLTKTGTFLYFLLTFYLNKGERWCTELLSVRSSWLSSTKPHHPFPACPFLDAAKRSLLFPGTLKYIAAGCWCFLGWWGGFAGGARQVKTGAGPEVLMRKAADWLRIRYVSKYSIFEASYPEQRWSLQPYWALCS